MPTAELITNVPVSESDLRDLSTLLSRLLGKPEVFVQVICRLDQILIAGSHDPSANLRIASIGLTPDLVEAMVEPLFLFIQDTLLIPPERAYIEFREIERSLCAWNGRRFSTGR